MKCIRTKPSTRLTMQQLSVLLNDFNAHDSNIDQICRVIEIWVQHSLIPFSNLLAIINMNYTWVRIFKSIPTIKLTFFAA